MLSRFIQQLFLHAEEYFRRGKQGQHQFLHDWVTGMGTLAPEDWAWDELAAFLSFRRLQPVNLLLSTYWTMGAVRHGSYVAKVRAAPTKESAEKVTRRLMDRASAQNVFRPALVAELQEHSASFDLQVQLCVDLEKMPVEDVGLEQAIEGIELVGCFVHARLNFVKVIDARGKGARGKTGSAEVALGYIGQLYRIEKTAGQQICPHLRFNSSESTGPDPFWKSSEPGWKREKTIHRLRGF